jgi:deoxyribodipyrimidine photo-lyase
VDQYVRQLNSRGIRPGGEYVLYWVRAARRVESNPSLALAAGLANSLRLPVLAFEGLTINDPYASDRFHTFILQGVAGFAAGLRKLGVGYCFQSPVRKIPEVETIASFAERAAAVVTDDWPAALSAEDPSALKVQCFAVDSSCIVPHTAIPGGRAYAAYSIRPKIHRLLPRYFKPLPPVRIERPYSFASDFPNGDLSRIVASCQIDHSVHPSPDFPGGRKAAMKRLHVFLEERLSRYPALKNEPSAHVSSDLSPYLHFGHISALEVALAARDFAAEHQMMADEFLDELIVRRELAFNFAYHTDRVDNLSPLPEWARQTLDAHRGDRRDPVYTRRQFEAAATHDNLWNAAQRELLIRGKIHGYYRMYWGKMILAWSATPEEALATMIHLHDRYALDGRDPNTYANILWCFGLHDRPWPERPIYGTVRSMTRSGMERKTDTAAYIREIEEMAS